jgi:hypothetical protein
MATDRIDNDGIPSTVKVLPEWQGLKVGDTVPIWRNLDFPVVALWKRIDIWFLRARINTTALRWGGTLSTEAICGWCGASTWVHTTGRRR